MKNPPAAKLKDKELIIFDLDGTLTPFQSNSVSNK